tara:strand:- start:582 stop:800 length:219 start_codon:yes stop_codon:yes gene_type:complete
MKMDDRGTMDLTKQIEELQHNNQFLTNQNKVLKEALRKAIKQYREMVYARDVYKRKVDLAASWLDELRDAGL